MQQCTVFSVPGICHGIRVSFGTNLLPSVGCRNLLVYSAFALQVIEAWEWVLKRRIFDSFIRIFSMDFVPS